LGGAGGGTVTGNLTKALQQFDSKFTAARLGTYFDSRHREMGYIVYLGSDGELYLSNLIQGREGIIGIEWVRELENPTPVVPNGVTLSLAGLHHTHPDRGKDRDPYSGGDAETFISFFEADYNDKPRNGRYTTTSYGGKLKDWYISNGYFTIAEDSYGYRYAQVLENSKLANSNIIKTRAKFNQRMFGTFDTTEGQFNRNAFKIIFTPNSGIGVYFGSKSYPKILNRLD
jgi:hypothetical protein